VDIATLHPDQIASLVARILNDKDPASVGLRRIVRKKTVEAYDFPMRAFTVENFAASGKGGKTLSDDDRRIIELERQMVLLKKQLDEQMEKARAAIPHAHAQGFDEGVTKGFAEGLEKAAGEYDKKIEELQVQVSAALTTLEREKNVIYANADKTLLELCRLMVRKILGVEPVYQEEAIRSVLRKALSYVAEKDKLVIRISPRDFETVSGNREFWTPIAERLKDITIERDERIERGGCIVESSSGVVDARMETQAAELGSVIEKAWENIHAPKNTSEAGNG
jgi:flagellar assembly protein FliH